MRHFPLASTEKTTPTPPPLSLSLSPSLSLPPLSLSLSLPLSLSLSLSLSVSHALLSPPTPLIHSRAFSRSLHIPLSTFLNQQTESVARWLSKGRPGVGGHS